MNFSFWWNIVSSKFQKGRTSAGLTTCRRRFVDVPQTLPPTSPQTLTAQNVLGASPILVFDLLYAQTQPFVLGLPVGFDHFLQRYYFQSFLLSEDRYHGVHDES